MNSESRLIDALDALETGSRPKGGVRGIAEGVPSLGGEHLDAEGGFRVDRTRYVPSSFYASMRRGHIRVGDVLIVKDGATTGKVSLVRESFPFDEAVVNEHVFICRPASTFDPRFLFWFLFSGEGQRRILKNFRGSAQGGINQQFASKTMVPVAPGKIQRQIADTADAIHDARSASLFHLDQAADAVSRLRQVVLAQAIDGRLTAGWRADPEGEDAKGNSKWDVPAGWSLETPASLIDPDRALTYGVIKLGEEIEGGVPTLRSSNVRWLKIDTDVVKTIARDLSQQYSRTILRGGEVVVTVRGTLGGVAMVPETMAGWNTSREVAVIPVKSDVNARYLAYAIGSPQCQSWLAAAARGASYTGVNLRDLRELPVPLPTRTEQDELVQLLDGFFDRVAAIESQIEMARQDADTLIGVGLDRLYRDLLR